MDTDVYNFDVGYKRTRTTQRVDLASDAPFDLESYAAHYQGRKKIERLMFIGASCPTLAVEAYAEAINTIMATTVDTNLYQVAVTAHNEAASAKGKQRVMTADRWVSETKRAAEATQDRLEVELKNQLNNLIKESIRLGYRDLGNHLHLMGDLQNSIRQYTKSRDYCTTSPHIIELCLSVIDVSLESVNYTFVRNFVTKAEAVVESLAPSREEKGDAAKNKAAAVHMPGMVQGSSGLDPREKERLRTIERLDMASGVAYLGQGHYQKCARSLLKVTREMGAGPGFEPYVSPGDVALYAVLCALATFDRNELKRRVIDNAELRPMLEFEPQLKEVLRAFRENRYKQALEILERYAPRHLLDIHLSPHIKPLMNLIRNRALVQYFSPFSSVALSRMAEAFGWNETLTETAVVCLIESGDLQARIDCQNRVVTAYAPDKRNAMFKNALSVGKEIERSNSAALLRLKLVQADVLVKEPKGSKGKKWEEPS